MTVTREIVAVVRECFALVLDFTSTPHTHMHENKIFISLVKSTETESQSVFDETSQHHDGLRINEWRFAVLQF